MNLDNLTPYLGKFRYTPLYLYVRMKDSDPTQIAEIKTIASPGDAPDCVRFIQSISETADINEQFKQKIQVSSRAQILKFANLANLSDEFNFDFDLKL